MSHRTALGVAVLAVLAAAPLAAQDGSLPRTADGRPDLQGYWDGGPTNASHSIEDGCCDAEHARMQSRGPERLGLPVPVIIDPPDGRIPYQPWAAERRTEFLYDMETPTELAHIDPEDRCLLVGVPRSNYRGDLQIRQNDGHVVFLYEWAHAYRVVPTDARPHVGADIRLFNGDSRGRWKATRWSSTSPTSTTWPGSTRTAASTARRWRWWSAGTSSTPTRCATRRPSPTRTCSRGP